MNYLRKRYLILLIIFLASFILIIIRLKVGGGGFRPSVLGGTGPWTWGEILKKLHIHILLSITATLIFAWFDYWSIKKENEKKE